MPGASPATTETGARRPAFRDAALQETFDRQGYLVLDWLNGEQVEQLQQVWQRNASAIKERPFATTLMSQDLAYRQAVHEQVAAVLTPLSRDIFDRYRLPLCSFLSKQPDSQGVVQLHHDWTFVDEARFQSVGIWCPLADVDTENGCLQVVPGSHKLYPGLRPALEPFPYADLEVDGRALPMIDVPMRAGQAFFFTQALFHSSPPNRSARERVVAGGLAIPDESRLRYVVRDADCGPNHLAVYEVDDEFYRTYLYGMRPDPAARIDCVEIDSAS
jgi:hypothetical protein